MLGTRVNDRYVMESRLGGGGGGEVYLVRDSWDEDRYLALKLLSSAGLSSTDLRRFAREFFTLRDIRHPNLVALLDYGRMEGSGRLYYTMEYVEGRDLGARAADLAPRVLARLAADVCRGLAFLHTRGILHADLKAENLLVADREEGPGEARIADFGLMRTLGRAPGEAGEPRGGTLAYMAPELLSGGAPGPGTDLYALGVVLYRCLAGRLPFQGPPQEIARAHLEKEPDPPSQHGAPAGWDGLLARLLAKDPAARPAASQVVADLSSLAGTDLPLETPRTALAYVTGAPFLEREDALAALLHARDALAREAASEAPVERGTAFLVRGEEGVGKSRLLRVFEERVVDAGIDYVQGDCRSGRDAPYAPIRQALAALASRRGEERSDPFREALEDATREGGEVGTWRLAEAATRLLMEQAARAPLVLAVENLQWLDEGSARILAYLQKRLAQVRRSDRIPLLVVGTTREGGPEGEWQEISLKRLTPVGTRNLVDSLFGGVTAPESFYQFIQDASDGNPLFVLETVRTAIARGALRRGERAWQAEPEQVDAGFPRRLADLARARVCALGNRPAQVGAALAILGEPSSRRLVEQVSGLSALAFPQAVDDLEQEGLVRTRGGREGGTLELAQSVFERVWYEDMDAGERRLLHGRAAEALEADESPAPERCARHWEGAEAPDRALPHLLAAAREAKALSAFDRVLDFSERALRATGAGGPGAAEASGMRAWALGEAGRLEEAADAYKDLLESAGGRERTELACALADVERKRGRFVEAREALARGGDTEGRTPETQRLEAARILLDLATGRVAEAAELAARAMDQGAGESRLCRAAGHALLSAGRVEEARRAARGALAGAEAAGLDLEAAVTRSLLARIRSSENDPEGAVGELRKALDTYRDRDEVRPRARLTLNLGVLEGRLGHTREAASAFAEAYDLMERTGDREGMALALNNLAEERWRQERYSEALDLYRRCRAAREDLGSPAHLANARVSVACVLLRLGSIEEAAPELERAAWSLPADAPDWIRGHLAVTQAELAAVRGDREQALESCREAIRLAENAGDPDLSIEAATTTARLFHHFDDPAAGEASREALRLARELGDPVVLASALVTAGRIESRRDRVRARKLLEEAVALARKSGRREPLWQGLAALAETERSPAAAADLLTQAMGALRDLAGALDSGHSRTYLADPRRSILRDRFLDSHREAQEAWRREGEFFPDPAVFSTAEDRSARRDAEENRDRAESLDQRLKRYRSREGRLASLMEVSREVNALRPLEELLPLIMDRAVGLLGAERGFLMLEGPGGELDFRVARDARGRDIDRADFQVSYSIVREVAGSGRALLSSDARSDERFRDQQSVISLDLRSVIVVPLQVGDRTLGVVYLDNRFDAGLFDVEDRELLEAFSAYAATAIENSRLYESLAERERMGQELLIAGEIQAGLLPDRLPRVGRFLTAGRMVPAREVGGDFFDWIRGEGGRVHLVVGDVSGKGVPAGLLMVMAHTTLRSLGQGEGGPREMLVESNRVLEGSIKDDSFLTAAVMTLVPETNQVLYTSAGHPRPLLYRTATGETEYLPSEGIALGILADCDDILVEERVEMAPGDMIVLYSDGVTECKDPAGNLYGPDRLAALVREQAGKGSEGLVEALFQDLERHRAGVEPSDDVTVVAVRLERDAK